jgi:hypothetical protein
MLESAGGEWNRSLWAPLTIRASKDLPLPGWTSHARRKSGKCKEWADSDERRNSVQNPESKVQRSDSRPLILDPRRVSNNSQLAANLTKGGEGLIEVCPGVGCGDLATNPRLTLGDDRVPEAGHEDAFG